jgi:hypothetical protein
MPIANSTILIYRKDLFGILARQAIGGNQTVGRLLTTQWSGFARPVRKRRSVFDGKRSEFQIRSGALATRSGLSQKARLSGLPFLSVLQRFPLPLLPKFKDPSKLFQVEHQRTDSTV